MRTSKFSAADVLRLLLLQYPVRCRDCRMRDFRSLYSVWMLKIARMPRAVKKRKKEPAMGTGPTGHPHP